MAYCLDFFRKWKREGNFCGLGEEEAGRMNSYLDLVEALVKQRIPEERVYELFTVGAARSLISAKGPTRTEGLNFVTKSLKDGKKITARDLQMTLADIDVKKSGNFQMSDEKKKSDPEKCFSPQPGSITPFTGLQGVKPSMQACQDAKCGNIVSRGGTMAKECNLSHLVPGNMGTCPLDRTFYYKKYTVTAACIEKGCEKIKLQRAGLHICTFTGMRPENHPHQICPLTPKEDRPAAAEDLGPGTPAKEVSIKELTRPEKEDPPAPADPPKPKPAPYLNHHPKAGDLPFQCPDGKGHLEIDNLNGRFCSLWRQSLKNLPGDECYCDYTARKESERPQPAYGLPPKSTQQMPFKSKHPFLPTRKEQDAFTDQFINNCLSDRYHRVIRDAMTDHQLNAPLDALCKGLDLLSECEGER
jgi:hypothetical protein